MSGSGRNIPRPDRVLPDQIAGHKAESRPGADEERRAVTEYDGMEIELILINQTEVGHACCQVWSTNFNHPGELGLQPTYHRLDVTLDKRGVGAD